MIKLVTSPLPELLPKKSQTPLLIAQNCSPSQKQHLKGLSNSYNIKMFVFISKMEWFYENNCLGGKGIHRSEALFPL